MNIEISAVQPEDEPILWQMLYEAAHMSESGETIVSAMQNPDLACYVAEWGLAGDAGFMAIDAGEAIGAAWFRLLTGDNKGYGFVDEEIPELAIGILPDYTGQGIGTELMRQLIRHAKERYPGLSLSVRANNAALQLYERLGFLKVPGTEVVNRVGEQSFNMILRFDG